MRGRECERWGLGGAIWGRRRDSQKGGGVQGRRGYSSQSGSSHGLALALVMLESPPSHSMDL